MKLYSAWRSSSSWRVRIALALKNIPYEYVPVNLLAGEQDRPEYKEKNPMSQIPVLEWVEEGSVRRLAQSLAIIQHLDSVYPAPPLLPADPYMRAQAWQYAEIINSGIQPFQNTKTLKELESFGGDKEVWLKRWIGAGLYVLEHALLKTASPFAMGAEVSLVDVCLIPQLYGARRFNCPLDSYPTLLKIERVCSELAAFQKAHADRQPDAKKE